MQNTEGPRAPSARELTLSFAQIAASDLALVGGKAANLGAMSRADIPVPLGFCVTALGFDAFVSGLADAERLFDALDALDGRDIERARVAGSRLFIDVTALFVAPRLRSAYLAVLSRVSRRRARDRIPLQTRGVSRRPVGNRRHRHRHRRARGPLRPARSGAARDGGSRRQRA